MAILDRPMFQRRPTKDELRQYGIPAFANGGIVVQKFAPGGDVTIPSGYQMSQAPFTQTVGAPTVAETIVDPKNYSSLVEKGIGMRSGGLKMEIQKLEAIIANPNMYSEAVVADAKARLPELKKQLIEAEASLKEGVDMEKVISEKEEKNKTEATGTIEDKSPEVQEDDITKEQDEVSRLKTLTLERSALYKEMLGDPREMMKQQGLLDLAQFGLNLASARGGNLAEKIAKSAADPLASFAKLAQDSSRDARAIDLAALQAAEEELLLEKKIDAEDTNQNKIIIYNEQKGENLNSVKTAEQTQILPAAEIKEIDLYRDDTNKISTKLINESQASNEFFYGPEGKVFKIKPGSLKKKYLTQDDFVEIDPNIEIIGAN